MQNAYITKRQAPHGYVAITRPLACALLSRDVGVTLCGNHVRHDDVFFGPWLGMNVTRADCETYGGFEPLVRDFTFHLHRELGTYPVFYVRKNDL